MKVSLTALPETEDYSISVEIEELANEVRLLFSLSGDYSEVSFNGSKSDELWQGTCFELFVQDLDGEGYEEVNCSPDGRFARMHFTSYRQGVEPFPFKTEPSISSEQSGDRCQYMVTLPIDIKKRKIAVSTVTESTTGEIRFWGIGHWDNCADFHRVENFFLPDFADTDITVD